MKERVSICRQSVGPVECSDPLGSALRNSGGRQHNAGEQQVLLPSVTNEREIWMKAPGGHAILIP